MGRDYVDHRNIGDYFIDADGSLWKMVGYCDKPQATFQRIDGNGAGTWGEPASDNALVTHVVGCPNHREMVLVRMVRENG